MFKHLSELISATIALDEATHPHHILSSSEITKMNDRFYRLEATIELLDKILEDTPDMGTGSAHTLKQIGEKAGFDMSYMADARMHLSQLEEVIENMHQAWGTQVQQETGELDDETSDEGDESHRREDGESDEAETDEYSK